MVLANGAPTDSPRLDDMASIQLRPATRQHLSAALSPRFQHAVRLLQMSSIDFATTVNDVMGRNPFLEFDEDAEMEGADVNTATSEASDSTDGDDRAEFDSSGEQRLETALDFDSGRVSPSGALLDGDGSVLDTMAAQSTLSDFLHGQLNVLPLSWRDLVLARTVVESLDDDGYLRTPLDELMAIAPVDAPAEADEMAIALRRVQALEPAGVAARDVGECLMLQMPSVACPDDARLARLIVGEHLQLLAARDTGKLARLLGETPARVQTVCERIRRFDPRPGWRFGSGQVAYVVPDVITRKVRGQWQVQLNPAVVPRVRLSRSCTDLFQRHRSRSDRELASHLQEAHWTLRNIEQRLSTIVDVAAAIVRRQRHFLDFGAMAMKPLGLREIADELSIHESTVSRVTNNKYLATPCGVFEMKRFFSRAMHSENGSACSPMAIRSLIGDIIAAERPAAPLSDVEITQQLAGQGLVVARRTVTKYRQMLRIDAADRRRLQT